MEKSKDILKKNIDTLLEKKHWKPADLVRKTHITSNTVYMYCRGERFPDAEGLDQIAKAFDVSVSELFSDSNSVMKEPEKYKLISDLIRLLPSLDQKQLSRIMSTISGARSDHAAFTKASREKIGNPPDDLKKKVE